MPVAFDLRQILYSLARSGSNIDLRKQSLFSDHLEPGHTGIEGSLDIEILELSERLEFIRIQSRKDLL